MSTPHFIQFVCGHVHAYAICMGEHVTSTYGIKAIINLPPSPFTLFSEALSLGNPEL